MVFFKTQIYVSSFIMSLHYEYRDNELIIQINHYALLFFFNGILISLQIYAHVYFDKVFRVK